MHIVSLIVTRRVFQTVIQTAKTSKSVPDGWAGDDEIVNRLVYVGAVGLTEYIPPDSQALGNNPGSGINYNSTAAQMSGGNVNTPPPGNGGIAYVNIVGKFLHEVSIPPEMMNEALLAVLRGYLRGRLNLQAFDRVYLYCLFCVSAWRQ